MLPHQPAPCRRSRLEFNLLPWYASAHRGAGWKSSSPAAEYEEARKAFASLARRSGTDDVAINCSNTTEAIDHLAYRLGLGHDDVLVTTVVKHHANLMPWSHVARCSFVECDAAGTFDVDAVGGALAAERLYQRRGGIAGWVDDLLCRYSSAHTPHGINARSITAAPPVPEGLSSTFDE